jgi:uncharacterized ParB-like nuclease family protein
MPKFIDRTSEKRMMNCGLEATIIRYGSSRDIDVQFEDGQVVYHSFYSSFKKGTIVPPNYTRIIDRTGEKRMMNCGFEATIIRYGGAVDIDVQFSNSDVVKHKSYSSFLIGQIALPKKSRLGEKRMMNCGLEATIIRYGSAIDIDVQFEDGQVVYKRTYTAFKKGKIAPPIDPRYSHLGEKRMMNCGLEATIIRYGSNKDIDVQFEDGQVVYHRDYFSFQKGEIAPPNYTRLIDRTGEKRMMNCGLEATIIRYGSYTDIDVQFEDGQVVYHRDYTSFKKGTIAHPGFKANKAKPSLYKSFITKYTGRHPRTGEPYYHCKCQKCGFEIIDTARNIIKLEHKCEITAT